MHWGGFLILASAVLLLGRQAMASDIEEPSFSRVHAYEEFEVRDYAPHVIAQTKLSGSYRESLGAGFRRLANFIFGGNTSGASIAMTAPVGSMSTGQGWTVTFSMPSAYTMQTLPRPRDGRVELVEVPARRVAVLKFSGWVSHDKMQAKEKLLREQLAREGLRATGPAVLAQYNPPWTLPFLRRNEILIPVQT